MIDPCQSRPTGQCGECAKDHLCWTLDGKPRAAAMTPATVEELDEMRAAALRSVWAPTPWPLSEVDSWRMAQAIREADARAGLVTVPRDPTKSMLDAAEEMHMPFGEMIAAWDGFVMASPFAGEGGEV